ncbi:hypothetical protein TorRG33x02_151810 [Trema orientale]|uniref:RNase H type-1 domain-containing protein n=1 Tax=Trema orientale TaxID=63057 RepID=A0A2P5ETS0_TREOI|nr:hypothetical protein TorRG33x02_151810 [Trema orientale]
MGRKFVFGMTLGSRDLLLFDLLLTKPLLFQSNGDYTVKTGYHILLKEKIGALGSSTNLATQFQGYLQPKLIPNQASDSVLAKWTTQSPSGLKLNTDASVRSQQGLVGSGFVIRDHLGAVMAAGTRVWTGAFSVENVELLALREGLKCLLFLEVFD